MKRRNVHQWTFSAAALALLLAAAPAIAAPQKSSQLNSAAARAEAADRAAILATLLANGIRPGLIIATARHVYEVETIEPAIGEDGAATITVKLKLLR